MSCADYSQLSATLLNILSSVDKLFEVWLYVGTYKASPAFHYTLKCCLWNLLVLHILLSEWTLRILSTYKKSMDIERVQRSKEELFPHYCWEIYD